MSKYCIDCGTEIEDGYHTRCDDCQAEVYKRHCEACKASGSDDNGNNCGGCSGN